MELNIIIVKYVTTTFKYWFKYLGPTATLRLVSATSLLGVSVITHYCWKFMRFIWHHYGPSTDLSKYGANKVGAMSEKVRLFVWICYLLANLVYSCGYY
jgi:hypothetical protein